MSAATRLSDFAPYNHRPGVPWHCVYSKPQSEVLAEVQLRQQGFVAWFPMESRRLSARQSKIAPLFPRYGFVQFDHDEKWGPIVNTRGVTELLRSPSGKPLDVPDGVMVALMEQCAPNGVIYPAEPREVQRGDRGQVIVGPFASFAGICTRTSRERVWLLLAIFGSREVVFERAAVELVG